MKALVIGGTRFVGLRLVRLLAAEGHEITLLNRGKTRADIPSGVSRVTADRRDPAAVARALAGLKPGVVFDVTGYEPSNIEPLVPWLKATGAHYVFTSTAGVYAPGDFLPVNENFPRVAVTPGHAGAGPYVERKVMCEDYLFLLSRQEGLPVTILRFPEIYGPENWMHEREPGLFRRLAEGRPVILPGNGASLLHLAYVDDAARAQLAVAGKPAAFGQAFNVAGPDWCSVDGWVTAAEEALGLKARRVYLPAEKMKALARPVFPFAWERNVGWGTDKTREALGFRAPTGIREGMKLAARWWKDNLGVAGTRFEPGRNGFDVDLEFEGRLAGPG
jgi:nucleoside-diphosphate-sugar epimerase